MFLPEGISFKKKMQRFSKLPSSNLHRKKLRSFAAAVVDIRSLLEILGNLGITSQWQNGTNSHVDHVEKLNFGCFGSPAFIPNTEKSWLVVDLPLWKILVKWDYCSQYTGKKHVPNHQPETYTDPLKSWTMPDSSTPSGGKHGKTATSVDFRWYSANSEPRNSSFVHGVSSSNRH